MCIFFHLIILSYLLNLFLTLTSCHFSTTHPHTESHPCQIQFSTDGWNSNDTPYLPTSLNCQCMLSHFWSASTHQQWPCRPHCTSRCYCEIASHQQSHTHPFIKISSHLHWMHGTKFHLQLQMLTCTFAYSSALTLVGLILSRDCPAQTVSLILLVTQYQCKTM